MFRGCNDKTSFECPGQTKPAVEGREVGRIEGLRMWCRGERSVAVREGLVFTAGEVVAPPSPVAWQACGLSTSHH